MLIDEYRLSAFGFYGKYKNELKQKCEFRISTWEVLVGA